MLRIRSLHKLFPNGVEALRGLDCDVREGEIVTLIGANGAGKSTLLMTICGAPRARSGAGRAALGVVGAGRRTRHQGECADTADETSTDAPHRRSPLRSCEPWRPHERAGWRRARPCGCGSRPG